MLLLKIQMPPNTLKEWLILRRDSMSISFEALFYKYVLQYLLYMSELGRIQCWTMT